MTYFTLHRNLALINIFILLVLTADVLMLPRMHTQEIYDHRSTYETRNSYRPYGTSHTTDYIVTVSGRELQVPADWQDRNIGLNEGDTFSLDRSFLLRQPVTLYVHWHGGITGMPMSALNNSFLIKLLELYILVVSLIQLLPWRLVKNDNWNERLIFSGAALLVVLLFFFFYH